MGIQSLSIFAMLNFPEFRSLFLASYFSKILLAKIDAALCQQPKHLMYLLHMAHFGIIGAQLHF